MSIIRHTLLVYPISIFDSLRARLIRFLSLSLQELRTLRLPP